MVGLYLLFCCFFFPYASAFFLSHLLAQGNQIAFTLQFSNLQFSTFVTYFSLEDLESSIFALHFVWNCLMSTNTSRHICHRNSTKLMIPSHSSSFSVIICYVVSGTLTQQQPWWDLYYKCKNFKLRFTWIYQNGIPLSPEWMLIFISMLMSLHHWGYIAKMASVEGVKCLSFHIPPTQ